MITIIHPSRSRPIQAYATAMKWIKNIGLPDSEFEYILSLDNDDPQLWEYNNHLPITNFTIFRSDNRSAIDAINIAAKFYSTYRLEQGDFLIVISDDFDCSEDWGKSLQNIMGIGADKNYGDCWILKTYDGIQDWIITLPILSWNYYRKFSYVYHPGYQHCFCDTEMTCVGWLTHSIYYSHIEFTHRPNGQIKDYVSERADKTFESGRKLFIERKARNFDLKPEDIKGTLPDNVYTRMQ